MRRALLAAVLLVVFLPAPALASRSDDWRLRAETAVAAFEAADTGAGAAFEYAYMASAVARLNGWADPRVTTYLDRVYALANPDGGYGLGYAYDAFGDGTVNPATTTYTITLAGHVGPVLLEGYRAGVVPAVKVQTVVDLLMSTNQLNTSAGKCVAYSRSSNDAGSTHLAYCVHNVNATVGAFLLDAYVAGFQAPGQMRLIGDITRREVAAYLTTQVWWPYMDTAALQDTDHNSASAEAMYALAPAIGHYVVYNHMAKALADNPFSPIAHMRLAGLAPQPAAVLPDGTSLWCQMGDAWLAEFDAFVANPPAPTGVRYAQAAYYASRNAQVC